MIARTVIFFGLLPAVGIFGTAAVVHQIRLAEWNRECRAHGFDGVYTGPGHDPVAWARAGHDCIVGDLSALIAPRIAVSQHCHGDNGAIVRCDDAE
jgi:hypothetical protein